MFRDSSQYVGYGVVWRNVLLPLGNSTDGKFITTLPTEKTCVGESDKIGGEPASDVQVWTDLPVVWYTAAFRNGTDVCHANSILPLS